MHKAPRLSIGVFHNEFSELAHALEGVGHHVTYLSEVEQAADYEMVIIDVADHLLMDTVEQLAARVRDGQIYLHTVVGRGMQALDALETSGAVVGAVARLDHTHWAVSALDELGLTIAELLVTEIGGRAVEVPDSQRDRLGAALLMQRLQEVVKQETLTLLMESVGDPRAAASVVGPQKGGQLMEHPSTLERYLHSIEDPGTARLFKDLLRRAAEVSGAHDVELWAMR